MSLWGLFRKEPVKSIHQESLPSLTFVINRIQELQERKPVHEHFKIRKATIKYANHQGPVDFLKSNIRLWNADHYLETNHRVSEGNYSIKKKDDITGRASKVQKPVFIHEFDLDYYVMVPYQGVGRFSNPEEQAPLAKQKRQLISAVLTLYVPK